MLYAGIRGVSHFMLARVLTLYLWNKIHGFFKLLIVAQSPARFARWKLRLSKF